MDESNRSDANAVTVEDAGEASATSIIDRYYAAFNERRFVEAGTLFADDAVLDQLPLLRQEPGAIGYLQFVSAWLRAFPDASFTVRQVTSQDRPHTFDVKLEVAGTHAGPLEIGGRVFRPTRVQVRFGLREVLEIREGRIAFSSLSYDMHEVIEKLARFDAPKLINHIERLHELANVLQTLAPESPRGREITAEIGRELDAARHVVRPYYGR
jgi:predicted ester cyclase